jgi:transcription elongation factor Elf1
MTDFVCDGCGKDVTATIYINRKGKRRATWYCKDCGIRGYEDMEEVTNEKKEE